MDYVKTSLVFIGWSCLQLAANFSAAQEMETNTPDHLPNLATNFFVQAQPAYEHPLIFPDDAYSAWAGHEVGDAIVAAHGFTDKTGFGQFRAGVDGRIPLTGDTFLTTGAGAWRFTNPGFDALVRVDGHAGVQHYFNHWLETSLEGDSFNNLLYHGHQDSFGGGRLSATISPTSGSQIYVIGAINQPFDRSIWTVTNATKQTSLGAGLNLNLYGRFSFQNSLQAARVTDGNTWWEERPQLSYQLFDRPIMYLRAQYDYLTFSQTRPIYWSPGNWRMASPILSTSIPLGDCIHFDLDASVPFVLNVSRFGYRFEGGPVIDLGSRIQMKASGVIAYIPGDQVIWSGEGWQAYIRLRF
jgi:hypothetical protein